MTDTTATWTFNTGRPYSAEGQRITIEQLSPVDEIGLALVKFTDHDRGIIGTCTVDFNVDNKPATEKSFLRQYDNNRYELA